MTRIPRPGMAGGMDANDAKAAAASGRRMERRKERPGAAPMDGLAGSMDALPGCHMLQAKPRAKLVE
jgi:hypothetical protein